MNLLKIKLFGDLFCARWFPMAAQLFLLVVFALLILLGLGITTKDGDFAKILRNTNIANLLAWSYWWPLVIVGAVVLGRLWCTVCPLELVTAIGSRVGLRLKVPRFMKSGWAITFFYALVLFVGVHTLSIHRLPHRMAIYLLLLIGLGLVISLIFEKRAFCSYICPVGHLLGLYAHCSIFKWGSADTNKCKSCKTKDCVSKKNHYELIGRSCTSNLYPATIKNKRDCLLCTQCQKACPYDNLKLSVTPPFADFFRSMKLNAAQVGFVLIVSGFVVYEIFVEWSASKAVLKWVPNQLTGWLGLSGMMADFLSGIVMFFVFPGLLFLGVTGLGKLLNGDSLGASAEKFAILLLPTMAGAHLLKGIFKMTSRVPYWKYVFGDPKGVNTATAIAEEKLILDTSIPNALFPVISYMAAGVFLTALTVVFLMAVKSPYASRLKKSAKVILFSGAFAYWAVFAITIYLWRF